ncbi:hypothetical protein FBU30_004950 [Linnemannia zychae]|nr:hypothetical protein FBU30_004950 [Linnemannia zychae]
MCGFGEKDRRPIDPPPIVQLILDEPNYNEVKSLPKPIAPVKPRKCKRKGAKRGRKPGKKTLERLAAAAAAAAAASKSHEDDDEDEEDEDQNDGEEDNMDLDEISGQNRDAKSKKLSDSDKQSPQQPRRRGRPSRANLIESHMSKKDEDSDDLDDSDQEWPRYEGGAEALRQDPLYVCQVSLWSEDGTEVRNMISTPGKTDPPRLTRILMGALVVSPTLLYNENNEMGWYFSFPDLSVRTEGVYTLKFSLLQFSNFDFDEKGGSHASTLVAEEISEPLTVYSAKKFPGMTAI